ncbi:hypothetical protein [Pseudaestuariivita rosea]|uniref:hypothetical protein n=1 Tax=Pseudaestuariivita rosea TaxID=2763263 RepID=UPI001ABB6EAE|nr:hypothetical protein [Pseudaestuariivita rosea]
MMLNQKLIAALGLTLTLGTAALADIVGTAVVDGKKVELNSDGTWAYVEAADSDCQTLHPILSFCGDPDIWVSGQPPNADIIAQYRYDDRHYGQFIVEALGANDGMSLEFMRDAVLQNAAAASGVPVSQIEVLEVTPVELSGQSGEQIVYKVRLNGLPIVMANSVLVSDSHTVQAMTFAIGQEYSVEHRSLNRTFMELTELDN